MSNVLPRWYFTKEAIENSPSRRCGFDAEKETKYRQYCASLIRDIGSRLKVGLMVCDTAIVYMHRFYMRHSFSKFQKNIICMSAIFLSSKVEESPRKLEHVIKAAYLLIYHENIDMKSELYQQWVADLVFHENLLLRTLGFDLILEHPQKIIMTSLNQFNVDQDVIQLNYYFASSMFLTSTFCLRFTPRVMACICIYIFKNWTGFKTPNEWWSQIDRSVTRELLKEASGEYLKVFETLPPHLKNFCFRNMSKFSSEFPRFNSSSQAKPSDQNNSSEQGALAAPGQHHHSNRSDSRHSQSHQRDSLSQSSHHKSSVGVHGSASQAMPPIPLVPIPATGLPANASAASSSSSSSASMRHTLDPGAKRPRPDIRNDSLPSKKLAMAGPNNVPTAGPGALKSTSMSTPLLQQESRNMPGSHVSSSTGTLTPIDTKSSREAVPSSSSLSSSGVGALLNNSSGLTGSSAISLSIPSALSSTGGSHDPSEILKMRKHDTTNTTSSSSSTSVILPSTQHPPPSSSSAARIGTINSSSGMHSRSVAANAAFLSANQKISKIEDGFKMEFSDNEDSNPMAESSLNTLDLMMNEQFAEKPFTNLMGDQQQQQPQNHPAHAQQPQAQHHHSVGNHHRHHGQHHHHHQQQQQHQQQSSILQQDVKSEKSSPFNIQTKFRENFSDVSMHLGPDHHSPAAIIRGQNKSLSIDNASAGNNNNNNSHPTPVVKIKLSGFNTQTEQPFDLQSYFLTANVEAGHDGHSGTETHKHKKHKKEKKKHKKEKKHKHKKKDKDQDREDQPATEYTVQPSNGLKIKLSVKK